MRTAPLSLALLALVLAGCGTTVIDTDQAETFIVGSVEEQVGARVGSVQCPPDVQAERGVTFECTVTGDDGTSGQVRVTGKDDEGNVSVSAGFVHVRNLEEQVAEDTEQQTGAKAKVTCPEIVEGERAATFDCEAVAGQAARTVRVTQKDDQAKVRYELVD